MRTENEVADRIRFLLGEELSKRVAVASKRLPRHCKHNYLHSLDVRKRTEGDFNEAYNRIELAGKQTIGLCMLGQEDPSKWDGTICEDPIDAQRCPVYDPIVTKDTLEEEFLSQIKDLEWVQGNLPEVYGLLWALGSGKTPDLPWWKRVWFRMISIRPDPLVSTKAEHEDISS